MSTTTTPTIDTSELLSSPSTWLTLLADAVARDDVAQARLAQSRLRELQWLVLAPSDVVRAEAMAAEMEADQEQEPPARQGTEP